MKIYSLTDIGNGFASQASNSPSPALRILYFIRRRGGKATDDQIKQFSGVADSDYGSAMSRLIATKAIQSV